MKGGDPHQGTGLYFRRDEIRAMRRENTVVRLDNKQRHTNETFKDYIANLNKQNTLINVIERKTNMQR